MSYDNSNDYSFDQRKVNKLNFFKLSHLNMHFFHEDAGIKEAINFQSL